MIDLEDLGPIGLARINLGPGEALAVVVRDQRLTEATRRSMEHEVSARIGGKPVVVIPYDVELLKIAMPFRPSFRWAWFWWQGGYRLRRQEGGDVRAAIRQGFIAVRTAHSWATR